MAEQEFMIPARETGGIRMIFKPIEMGPAGILMYESNHQGASVVSEHHHTFHQLLYVLEGEGTLTLDRKKISLSRNCAAFIVPYGNHAIQTAGKMTVLVLAFDQARLNEGMLERILGAHFQMTRLWEFNPFAGSELRQLLRKLLHELTGGHPMGDDASRVYLLALLLFLARSGQSETAADSNRLRAERIRDYINAHYFEKINTDDIAVDLGLTVRYVNDIFKSRFRITPTQYLSEVRIEAARKLLAETDKDIVSIAFEVGYETLSTFYRNFKNVVFLSPNDYRQLHCSQKAVRKRFPMRPALLTR